jgi:TolA-binding protein
MMRCPSILVAMVFLLTAIPFLHSQEGADASTEERAAGDGSEARTSGDGFVEAAGENSAAAILESGREAFRRGDYQQALVAFRELLVEGQRTADAHFWIAKAAMALGNLQEAERSLEQYLNNFPEHPDYPEARYQKARLLFMQREHEKALRSFERFISEYPQSPYIANANYWAAEALFRLGRLDEARAGFQKVVNQFPRSYRVEAARYRLSVIRMNRREEELLRLLQWSHERYLSLLEQNREQKQTFEEALASYQERLAGEASDAAEEEIRQLRNRVSELRSQLEEARDRVSEQGNTGQPTPDTAEAPSEALLRLKERALTVKSAILDRLISDARAERGSGSSGEGGM